MGNSDS